MSWINENHPHHEGWIATLNTHTHALTGRDTAQWLESRCECGWIGPAWRITTPGLTDPEDITINGVSVEDQFLAAWQQHLDAA